MRLGDLDRIAQEVRENNAGNYDKRDWTSHLVVTLLENAPTIDAVPVVRCRECRHYDNGCCVVKHCEGDDNIIAMPPDGYCSYGQRKEAANEVSEP